MTTTRFAVLVGILLGAVYALAGFADMLVAGLLGAIGYVIALVVEGRINVDLDELTGRGERSGSGNRPGRAA